MPWLILVQVKGAMANPVYQVVASVRLKVPWASHGRQFIKNSVAPPLLLHQSCLTLAPLFGGWASRFGWGEGMRLMLTTDLCGGFTTFSTFSKESLALAEAGRWCAFAAYAVGSVSVGIVAVALGYWLAKN